MLLSESMSTILFAVLLQLVYTVKRPDSLSFSYVNGKGWQHYFKTYCIPEDLVPRILSPAYFHHYNSQVPTGPVISGTSPSVSKYEEGFEKQKTNRSKENEGEQLVLGLGPVQNPLWRLSRLVPIEGLRRQFYNRGNKVEPIEISTTDSASTSTIDDLVTTPQSLEIEESSDGISLRPLPEKNEDTKNEKSSGTSNSSNGDKKRWRRIPSLPSYIPFGQVRLSIDYFSDCCLVILYMIEALL